LATLAATTVTAALLRRPVVLQAIGLAHLTDVGFRVDVYFHVARQSLLAAVIGAVAAHRAAIGRGPALNTDTGAGVFYANISGAAVEAGGTGAANSLAHAFPVNTGALVPTALLVGHVGRRHQTLGRALRYAHPVLAVPVHGTLAAESATAVVTAHFACTVGRTVGLAFARRLITRGPGRAEAAEPTAAVGAAFLLVTTGYTHAFNARSVHATGVLGADATATAAAVAATFHTSAIRLARWRITLAEHVAQVVAGANTASIGLFQAATVATVLARTVRLARRGYALAPLALPTTETYAALTAAAVTTALFPCTVGNARLATRIFALLKAQGRAD